MARRASSGFLLISSVLLALVLISHGRPIGEDPLVSDGIVSGGVGGSPASRWWWSGLRLPVAAAESCEQSYGFLPCTTTIWGNLFLVLVYGFFMFKAATYLSSGSELLLEILGPGIVGGLFLPILGALPDALLILVSGLFGSKEEAQSQVLVGMGLLSGSTVFLLTLLWGSCVAVAKCDLSENSTSIDSQDTKKFSLSGSGVTTDTQTSYAARIMALSIIPFVIVQLPKIFSSPSADRVAVLIALIAAVAALISYCVYQIYQPWIQSRKLAFAKHRHVISGILRHAQMVGLGRLFTNDGQPNEPVIRKLFHRIDLDSDGVISRAELNALILGTQFENIDDLDQDDAVNKIMADFDQSRNNCIEEDEFVNGIIKWMNVAKSSVGSSGAYSRKFINDFHQKTKEEHDTLTNNSEESTEGVENPTRTRVKAVLLLLLGAVIAAAFADPLVDAVDNFSTATGIPSFFISFIALPFATNSSEAVSAIIFASRKKQRTASLTFSEIYGGATMNNTLCLAVFLALVYVRHLTWDFSSEVLVILLVCVIMGLFTSFRTTFPLWTCFIAFLLYPLSLVIVYVLDYCFGWS